MIAHYVIDDGDNICTHCFCEKIILLMRLVISKNCIEFLSTLNPIVVVIVIPRSLVKSDLLEC